MSPEFKLQVSPSRRKKGMEGKREEEGSKREKKERQKERKKRKRNDALLELQEPFLLPPTIPGMHWPDSNGFIHHILLCDWLHSPLQL